MMKMKNKSSFFLDFPSKNDKMNSMRAIPLPKMSKKRSSLGCYYQADGLDSTVQGGFLFNFDSAVGGSPP